jgi:acetyl esterase/lipase
MAPSVRLPRPAVRALCRVVARPVTGHAAGPALPLGLRRQMTNLLGRVVPPPAGTEISGGRIGGLPAVRMTHPSADRDRVVLFLHGGGYKIGSPTSHRGYAGHLSRAARATVYLLDYRLAPEHPFPAALEDAVAAYRALLEAGYAPQRTAIAGDSAGGGLSLATAITQRDAGEPLPAALCLICPWLDLTLSGDSITSNAGREPLITSHGVATDSAAYSGSQDPGLPGISPLFADLGGLPPIHLQGAGDDLIVSDANRFAERAAASGVNLDYVRYEGLWHDFQLYAGLLGDADRAVEDAGSALRAIWEQTRFASDHAG